MFEENPTRRDVLAMIGLGALSAVLASCETTPVINRRDLPESSPGSYSNAPIIPDNEKYAPPTPAPDVVMPKKSTPTNTFGIIPRSAWTSTGPNLKTIDPMEGVGLITFHHSGDPKIFTASDYGETAAHLEHVRKYHRSQGFQDIGYHFAIDRMGRVWQLRSLKYQGQHVRYNNAHNIGVVVLGNFQLQKPTQQQFDRIKTFGNLLRKQYGLPIARVKTHQEIVSTECPGTYMQPFMVQVRRQALI